MYLFLLFFFNDTATTEIYTLSLHDALPILEQEQPADGRDVLEAGQVQVEVDRCSRRQQRRPDRKSTRLNSSHSQISYAVFCLKKKILRVRRSPGEITRLAALSSTWWTLKAA